MDIQKLFGEDLTSVDISRPLFPKDAQVEFEVFDCRAEENKDKTGMNLQIFLTTVYAEKNDKGGTFNPGYKPANDKPTAYISLTETEKRNEDNIAQDLKKFQVACGRSGVFGQPGNFIGAHVKCRCAIEKDSTGQYPDKNRFIWILPKQA